MGFWLDSIVLKTTRPAGNDSGRRRLSVDPGFTCQTLTRVRRETGYVRAKHVLTLFKQKNYG
jgi:hypothetical protein